MEERSQDAHEKGAPELVSTVTTTTVSTVSTVSTVTAIAMTTSLALVAIFTLLVLLIQKELFTAATGPRAKALGRVLNAAILPLLIVFFSSVVVKVVEILR